jgi:hypothetical protein
LRGEGPSLDGKWYKVHEAINSPAPVGKIPIMIGGGGERKTLRLVARYADACNFFVTSPEVVAHKIDVLKRHCDAEGRDPSEIEITILGGDPGTDPDGFLRDMERYARLGVALVEVMPNVPDPAKLIDNLGERIIPRLNQL